MSASGGRYVEVFNRKLCCVRHSAAGMFWASLSGVSENNLKVLYIIIELYTNGLLAYWQFQVRCQEI